MLWAPVGWGMWTAQTLTLNHKYTDMLKTAHSKAQHIFIKATFYPQDSLPTIIAATIPPPPPSYLFLLCFFSFWEKKKQAYACCVVVLNRERGPDPEKRGGVGRLLTPRAQTIANGEQVWWRRQRRLQKRLRKRQTLHPVTPKQRRPTKDWWICQETNSNSPCVWE